MLQDAKKFDTDIRFMVESSRQARAVRAGSYCVSRRLFPLRLQPWVWRLPDLSGLSVN